ncbi:cysteine desulfurase CsdA [Rahnella aquatilis]|uniref:Probable cysteine desulfurase n=1 Tax=Rahnella aquatilis (strain ATCC 33071 / DSM 4594 / JCM 1683 / NBRC 105701 / NCIMB 13365 / CIP 78.65) TaxID=745277 RepID=H2IXK5_RAHAC|nr:cysteine desulfurase CsdA [Rahnella aquatilis]AEX50808.1 cysteine desulfurase, catalytic subunit CsdA [Rahnella aquatilis CIP 78.65 = ATCC 33071]KFD01998.1 CsdA family cysteine desulfurase component [Rahnella aquatilis CIP 78.65 = ATCC 33071]
MTDFNPADFRQQFPALSQGQCYLDSAATALKPQAVIEATLNFYSQEGATVHRSQHRAAQSLTETYEQARTLTAQWINAPRAANIVWTRGTTESINLVAQSWLRPRLQPGDQIIVSQAEHHANLIPWLMVAEQCQAQVITLPVDEYGIADITALSALLNNKTRLLALTQMSNVTGGIPDIARAIELAHANNTSVLIDGAQGVVHCPPDVQQLDIDFYAFSGHKLYGPTGIGVLYGKTELLENMAPWQGGGKMLTRASMTGFTPQAVPYRFEAGTPNIAGVIGMSAALKWLNTLDLQAAEKYTQNLASLAEEQLTQIDGFRSFRCQNSSVLAFDIAGVHHSDLVALLAEQDIALRAGQHCAQPLMDALGISGTLRASFAPYNNEQDVMRLVGAVKYALDLLAG